MGNSICLRGLCRWVWGCPWLRDYMGDGNMTNEAWEEFEARAKAAIEREKVGQGE